MAERLKQSQLKKDSKRKSGGTMRDLARRFTHNKIDKERDGKDKDAPAGILNAGFFSNSNSPTGSLGTLVKQPSVLPDMESVLSNTLLDKERQKREYLKRQYAFLPFHCGPD